MSTYITFATVLVAACGASQPEISNIELEWCTAGNYGIGLAAAQELGRAEEFREASREWAMEGFLSRVAFYESSTVARASCQLAYDRAAAGRPLKTRWMGLLPEVVRWCHYHMEAVLAAAHDLGFGDDIGTYGVDFTSPCSEAFRASGLDISQLPEAVVRRIAAATIAVGVLIVVVVLLFGGRTIDGGEPCVPTRSASVAACLVGRKVRGCPLSAGLLQSRTLSAMTDPAERERAALDVLAAPGCVSGIGVSRPLGPRTRDSLLCRRSSCRDRSATSYGRRSRSSRRPGPSSPRRPRRHAQNRGGAQCSHGPR